jgi:hypothetical protein
LIKHYLESLVLFPLIPSQPANHRQATARVSAGQELSLRVSVGSVSRRDSDAVRGDSKVRTSNDIRRRGMRG